MWWGGQPGVRRTDGVGVRSGRNRRRACDCAVRVRCMCGAWAVRCLRAVAPLGRDARPAAARVVVAGEGVGEFSVGLGVGAGIDTLEPCRADPFDLVDVFCGLQAGGGGNELDVWVNEGGGWRVCVGSWQHARCSWRCRASPSGRGGTRGGRPSHAGIAWWWWPAARWRWWPQESMNNLLNCPTANPSAPAVMEAMAAVTVSRVGEWDEAGGRSTSYFRMVPS